MIKHASTAQELDPKAGKVSGQAWNADHKLGVGYMAPIAVGEFQIGLATAYFFDTAASRAAAGHYFADAPYQIGDFIAAALTGLATIHFVLIPHTPLPSGWYFEIAQSTAGNSIEFPVATIKLRNDAGVLADPSYTIRGQVVCYATSAYEPA